jgi:hypothetical protein
MLPMAYFTKIWDRANVLSGLHIHLSSTTTSIINTDELLRAEWAMRVSALDLYVHELVALNLMKIFRGERPVCDGFRKLQFSSLTLLSLLSERNGSSRESAFDLAVREKLERMTFQSPDNIADGIRYISSIDLWAEIAKYYGASGSSIESASKGLKASLKQIVDRRNKIVHEGDLQPTVPRSEWTISSADLKEVKKIIERIVISIDQII